MNAFSYKWSYCEVYEPIHFCISDNLSPLSPHLHDEIELMYFYDTDGGKYFCNGKYIDFSRRELIVVNSKEIHSCDNWGEHCSAVCVMINPCKLSAESLINLTYENKVSDLKIDYYFNKLKSAVCEEINKTEKKCKLISIIYSILGTLSKYSAPQKSSYNHRRGEIDGILRYIGENLSENLTSAVLAEKMHLSKDRFYHVFKEYMGVSPINYILTERIKKACELLENTDMTIQEIASECNFCTSSYFTKKFFEYMKIMPSEYRKHKYSYLWKF